MIDILLPTYNGEAYLEYLLDSILNQTINDFKIIIRDDGSTDGTVNIIQKYVSGHPSKITFLEDRTHLGINLSFNELMKNSGSDYIMFADQDDVWLPYKIEISYNKIREVEKKDGENSGDNSKIPALVHSDLKVVDKDLKILDESFFEYIGINPHKNSINRLLVKNTVTGCTVIINRKLLELALPISEHVYFYDYYIALTARLFGVIYTIRQPLILYRQHSANDVGASKLLSFNPKKMAKKIKKIKKMNYHFYQASVLFNRFKDRLNEADKEILYQFISIKKKNSLQRIIIIFKYKFFGQGFFRNIGLFTAILFFLD